MEQVTDAIVEEAIPHVARALDVLTPGWADKIDLDRLEMLDTSRCIGGQMGMDWEDITDRVWESGLTPIATRLIVSCCFASGEETWEDQIRERTGAIVFS